MADNYDTNRDNQTNVAADDPFAELARIMSQGSQAEAPAPAEEEAAPAEQATAPEEPAEADPFAVDLEKELLGDLDEVDTAYAEGPAKDDYAPASADDAEPDYAPEPYEPVEAYGEPVAEQPYEPVADDDGYEAGAYAPEPATADWNDAAPEAEPLNDDPVEQPASEWQAADSQGDVEDSVLADVDMDFGDLDAPASAEPVSEGFAVPYEEAPAPEGDELAAQPEAEAALSLEDELEMLLADGSPAATAPQADEMTADDAAGHAEQEAFPEPAQQSSVFSRANYAGHGGQDDFQPELDAENEPAADYDDAAQAETTEAADPFAELASVISAPTANAPGASGAEEATQAAPDIPFEFETVDVPEPAAVNEDDLPLPDLPADDFVASHPADDFEPGFDYQFDAGAPAADAATAAYADEPSQDAGDESAQSDEDRFYAEALGFSAAAAAARGFDTRRDGEVEPLDADLDRELEDAIAEPDAFAIPPEEQPARRNGFMIAGVVIGIAVLGGIGAFALSSGGGDNETPVLVEADNEPLKVKPADPGGGDEPLNQDSVAYDAATGVGADDTPQQESLVTTTEEPVNIASRVVETSRLPGVDDEQLSTDGGAAGKAEDRLQATTPEAANEVSNEVIAVQPRRVRTMIVRPDGTLVPREEAEPVETAAASSEATTAAPIGGVQPEPLAQPAETAGQTGTAATTEQPETVAGQDNGSETVAAGEAGAPAVSGAEQAATNTNDPVTPAVAPIAQERPANQETTQPRQVAQAAPAATRTQPAAPAPAATASSEWSMQIASQPSAESAQATYQELARRYGSLLDGRGVNIVRAEIAGKGTYYRVRIPTSSRSDGIALCERYKAAGGSCFVSK